MMIAYGWLYNTGQEGHIKAEACSTNWTLLQNSVCVPNCTLMQGQTKTIASLKGMCP